VSETLGDVQDRTFAASTAATAASYPADSRLSADQLVAYLDRRTFAVVGSVRRDGRPHAAMSSYVRRGNDFWLPTVAGSVRERNIRIKPWLTLVVTEGDHGEHIVVILEGPAGVVGPTKAPAEVQTALSADWVSVWIRVQVQRVLSYASDRASHRI